MYRSRKNCSLPNKVKKKDCWQKTLKAQVQSNWIQNQQAIIQMMMMNKFIMNMKRRSDSYNFSQSQEAETPLAHQSPFNINVSREKPLQRMPIFKQKRHRSPHYSYSAPQKAKEQKMLSIRNALTWSASSQESQGGYLKSFSDQSQAAKAWKALLKRERQIQFCTQEYNHIMGQAKSLQAIVQALSKVVERLAEKDDPQVKKYFEKLEQAEEKLERENVKLNRTKLELLQLQNKRI